MCSPHLIPVAPITISICSNVYSHFSVLFRSNHWATLDSYYFVLKQFILMVVNSGYMSPEYAMEGNFSVKSDVFSFGVLILEIVSGRRNNHLYHLDRPLNLIGYVSLLLLILCHL